MRNLRTARTWVARLGFLALFVPIGELPSAAGQRSKSIACPDGTTRITIDLKAIAIQYEGASFAATLGSLNILGTRLSVEPKTLQQAAAATQQWNEFLKGLVAGYNSCAISKQSYEEGLTRIYPRLKDDAADIEQIRKTIEAGRQADEKRLKNLLDSYLANFRRFAEATGRDGLFEKIMSYVDDQIAKLEGRLNARFDAGLEEVNARVQQVVARIDQLEMVPPAAVEKRIPTGVRAAAAEAVRGYETGYELVQRFRFEEAIPHFRQAVATVSRPEIHFALGNALLMTGLEIQERPKRTDEDHKKSQRLLEEAKSALLASAAAYPEDDPRRRERADVYLALGAVSQALDRSPAVLQEAADYNRTALALLDCKHSPEECIQGYMNLAAALESMPSKDQEAREHNLEAAAKALDAAERLVVQQQWDPFRRASFDRNLAIAVGHRFRGGRERNLRRAIEIGERALPVLAQHVPLHTSTYVLLLNHLGTLYARLADGDRMAHLRRAREAFETGLRFVGRDRFPEFETLLRGNLKGLDDLIARGGALPDEEVLGRFSVEMAELKESGKLEEALAVAWRSRQWAEERFGSIDVHVAMAHNSIGSLYAEQGNGPAATTNLYCALAILHKALRPDDPWSHLLPQVQMNYQEALRFLGGQASGWPAPSSAVKGVDQALSEHDRARGLYATDPAAALEALDQALTHLPCYSKGLGDRASVKMQLRDLRGAFDDAEAALMLNPKDTVALFHRAQIQMAGRRWSEAIADLDAVLQLDPGDIAAYQQRARSHEAAGHVELAARDWRAVLVKAGDEATRAEAEKKLQELQKKLRAP